MISGQTMDQEGAASDEQLSCARSRHDIRASLAITNGFNQALETSFSDLCETYEHLLRNCNTPSVGNSAGNVELVLQIEKLEADCHFCISRIKRSLEQLGSRIDSDLRMRNQAQRIDTMDNP